jgi:hypothetical protein
MTRKALCAVLALAVSLCPVLAPAQVAVAVKDPEVAKGIKAVEDGDYDAAIFILDGATRRLAADPRNPDLPQAYLHLGIAYVGKGAEAAAKAKFREALKQMRDLALSADKYPPKVINVFEAARDEVAREGSPATPARPAAPPAGSAAPAPQPKKGGGGKTLLIIGGLAAAGAGVAVAAGGGGSDEGGTGGGSGNLQTRTFPNEVVVFGGGRDFVVDARGSGTLTARCTWVQDGVLLSMYVVSLANPGQVLKDAGQTGSKELTLTQAVTQGSYRISVTNSSGAGPVVDTTFTLTVTLP